MLEAQELKKLYFDNSATEIAKIKKCSVGQVNYWLAKYLIEKRTISEAIYKKHNPDGDPFLFKKPDGLDIRFRSGFILG